MRFNRRSQRWSLRKALGVARCFMAWDFQEYNILHFWWSLLRSPHWEVSPHMKNTKCCPNTLNSPSDYPGCKLSEPWVVKSKYSKAPQCSALCRYAASATLLTGPLRPLWRYHIAYIETLRLKPCWMSPSFRGLPGRTVCTVLWTQTAGIFPLVGFIIRIPSFISHTPKIF